MRVSGGKKKRTARRSEESTRNHSVNEPGPSGTSLATPSNPGELAGITGEEALRSGFGERNNAEKRG